jgi:hypothetical protein
MVAALLAQDSASSLQQRWGILEACRKISSVRSVSEARSRAIRESPRPSRWAEAIEQHSAPEAPKPQPLFAAEILAAETITTETSKATETEREELL